MKPPKKVWLDDENTNVLISAVDFDVVMAMSAADGMLLAVTAIDFYVKHQGMSLDDALAQVCDEADQIERNHVAKAKA